MLLIVKETAKVIPFNLFCCWVLKIMSVSRSLCHGEFVEPLNTTIHNMCTYGDIASLKRKHEKY